MNYPETTDHTAFQTERKKLVWPVWVQLLQGSGLQLSHQKIN